MSFVIPSDLLELASGYIGSGWVLVLIFLAHMEAQILVTFFLFILPYFCTLYLCNTYNAGNVPLGELNPPLPVIATNAKRGNPSTPYSLVACTPCTGSTTHGKYARVKYSTSCRSSPYSQGECPDRHHHHRRNRLDLTIVRWNMIDPPVGLVDTVCHMLVGLLLWIHTPSLCTLYWFLWYGGWSISLHNRGYSGICPVLHCIWVCTLYVYVYGSRLHEDGHL